MLAANCKETVAQEAARLGVSERRAYQIRAKEREGRAGWGQPREERLDPHDYPYMELVTAPSEAGSHDWCKLEPTYGRPGNASRDGGKVHVGGRVQSLGFGREADDANLTDDLTNATSYSPDPDGLKGGVG